MLPKKERLSRIAFSQFFAVGKRSHSPSFQVVYVPHQSLHASVVVSKKIARHAVQRNKIRRRIYDILRNYRSEKKIQGVFIFLVKASVLEKDYALLKNEVRTCIDNILKFNR